MLVLSPLLLFCAGGALGSAKDHRTDATHVVAGVNASRVVQQCQGELVANGFDEPEQRADVVDRKAGVEDPPCPTGQLVKTDIVWVRQRSPFKTGLRSKPGRGRGHDVTTMTASSDRNVAGRLLIRATSARRFHLPTDNRFGAADL